MCTLKVFGDGSGCEEADDDASSLLEDSVAADAAVELESDRSFLLVDTAMIYMEETRGTSIWQLLFCFLKPPTQQHYHLDNLTSHFFSFRGRDGIRRIENDESEKEGKTRRCRKAKTDESL